MNETNDFKKILANIQTADLWAEIARRFNIKYGKIQMAIHQYRCADNCCAGIWSDL